MVRTQELGDQITPILDGGGGTTICATKACSSPFDLAGGRRWLALAVCAAPVM